MNLANNPNATAGVVLGFSQTQVVYNCGSPVNDYRIKYRKDAETFVFLAPVVTAKLTKLFYS